ncbi:MAG: dihydroxy-acid dehydratase, partial [Gammaproteobacteria bacterium]|nr:dihydroxy-acid dehydratase [Gammaproteobacteria bacterium]
MANTRKRPYSSIVVDGLQKAAARAMLHAVGFSSEDFQKPQIGVASTWSNLTPCNMHINDLAEATAIGIEDQQGKAITFNTITVSDG